MTQIFVSDEVAAELATAATSRGCSREALATFLLRIGLRQQDDVRLTPQQEERLMESIGQA